MRLIAHGTQKKTKRFLLLTFNMCIFFALLISPASICYASNSSEGLQTIISTVIENGKTIEKDQDPGLAYYNSPTDFGYPEGVQGGRWTERHGNNAGGINLPYYSAGFLAPMLDKYYQTPYKPIPVDRKDDTKVPPSAEDLIATDYPEMVRLLELLYQNADIRDNTLNPTYGFMMKREPVITLTAGYQEELRELAKLTFKDIRGDEWYAPHIPLSVYRKLVKGFPDKTFKGGNLVTRAEVLTMLARFKSSESLINQKAKQDVETWIRFSELIGNDWYTQYVVAAQDGLVHPDQYTRETILKPMIRGEVIYALANLLWNEDIQEGGKYYNMAVVNDNPAFNDTIKTITISNPDVGTIDHKAYSWYKQLVLAAENPKAGVPMDLYPAILCLKDKGILLGNKGDSKWNDPITRAEVLALFERLARVWGKAPTPTPASTPGAQKTYYVRQGANGDNNGTDWNNAWIKLPDDLERGATYYIAKGTYPAYKFDDPEKGDAYIVIKKATAMDYGTNIGWKNGYAEGAACFTDEKGPVFNFTKGYYIIDGQTGEDDNGHGIKLYNPMNIAPHLGGNCMTIPNKTQVRHLTLKHIEMEDAGWAGSGKDDAYITRTIYATGATAHITFQYCYIHDSGQEWMLFSNPESDFLIEHCYFKNGGSGSSASHSVGIWHRGEKENMNIHIRYNTFENFAAAGGTGYISLGYRGDENTPTYSSGYYIYGNIFKETSPLAGPSRVIGSNGANGGPFLSDVKIYNNTFYNMNGKLASRIVLANKGDNNLVANNIWYGCDNAPSIANIEEKNNIKNDLTDAPFIDAAGGIFWLNRELPGGMVLDEPFNKDMDGAVRGTDNKWDIGAFEYKAPTTIPSKPAPTQTPASSSSTTPIVVPATSPTVAPSTTPTAATTTAPTATPTTTPAAEPTVVPTAVPTVAPTAWLTATPTTAPTPNPDVGYTLTVHASNGYVTANPDKDIYSPGETVELFTRPAAGYSFKAWSGDLSGYRLRQTIIMDGDKTVTAAFETWKPPIGISAPEFGIFEDYRMYDNPSKRNSDLNYYQNTEGGYYTHYVDNTHPDATDKNNTYGSADKPRLTLLDASSVLPGSVVEFHGGPYNMKYTIYRVDGTRDLPIFIRGFSVTDRVELKGGDIYLNSSYLILENFKRVDEGICVRSFADRKAHHACVRNCDTAGLSALSWDGGESEDIVFYGNYNNSNSFDPDAGEFDEKDGGGIGINLGSNRVWIVDNHTTRAGGDASGGGHAANYTARNYYIGRNIMHTCGENAIDIKEVDTVIASQNIMYDFQGWSSGSDGTAIVVHYGPINSPKNVWFLYNEIFDVKDKGIQTSGGQKYPVYLIGNVFHNIHNQEGKATGLANWDCREVFLSGNIFHDVDNGINWIVTGSNAALILKNNIFSSVRQGGYHLRITERTQRENAQIGANLFFQPGGSSSILWGNTNYTVDQFMQKTGKGAGSMEADPLFVSPQNGDFRLQPGSPAIDKGQTDELYQIFKDRYGIDIRIDASGNPRPQGDAWDIGAYE